MFSNDTGALLYLLAILGMLARAEAAMLNTRDTPIEIFSGNSATGTLETFVDPLLPTVSGALSTAALQMPTALSYTVSSSSATTTGSGEVSEDPNNATDSSNAHQSSCHRTSAQYHLTDGGPFCEPNHFEDVWAGRTYSAIWDPDLYGDGANVTVTVSYAYRNDGADEDILWTKTLQNSVGEVEIEMETSWLQGDSRKNLTLGLTAEDGDIPDRGPTISLIVPPGQSNHTGSSKLGVEVGVPIALVFLAALCIGLFLVFRRRKRGYLGGKTRSQRLNGHGEVALTGDDIRTTTRSRHDSFKDEPVQGGVELQPQPRVGHRREDSMGGSLSPMSPVSPISPVRTSNVFRDELERQRAGGR